MKSEAVYANAFNQILEVGPARLRRLKDHFGSFEHAWHANTPELVRSGMEPTIAQGVIEKRSAIDPARAADELEREKITVLLPDDEAYPVSLATIPVPPQILYVQGLLPSNDCTAVAVVGTRSPTRYGLDACEALTRELAQAGIVIVSGLAVGIDTAAHRTALAHNGTTVAVLGSGLSQRTLYPASNKKLSREIAEHGGAVVSEYPLSMKAQLWTFPQRNRIIAGLTAGTLVVEAKEKSGARITASYALDSGREVFAVPGQIFSETAATPNWLIRQGAAAVTSAQDIFEALGISYTPAQAESTDPTSPDENAILALLAEPKSASDLARLAEKQVSLVNQTVSMLELRGMIRRIGGGLYAKIQ